ncbi:MAG: hypothetical protein J6Y92_02295 [Lentisphaeria bacterium]|nr:hypothetical protein [Lentisphaeria bacterium]
MTNVIFNSGFIGFLVWVLLFAVSTAALAIAIRCVWGLHKTIFAMAEFKEKLIPFLFLAFALMFSVLPLRVQAALPKELPTAPTKFLTGACLTRSEDLWITAEAGGVYRLSGQEMKPKWKDMRKQPGFPKTDNCQSITKQQQLETSPEQHPSPPPAD